VDFADAQQRAVADAGNGAVTRTAPKGEADLGRLAMRGRVPFGGLGDKLAVPVATGDLADDDFRQSTRNLKAAVIAIDLTLVPQSAQQAVQFGFARGI